MNFLKKDLTGTHYSWLKWDDENIFVGQPTYRPFNRYNGNQVLFIINYYRTLSAYATLKAGKKIEYDLINHLPIGSQSEISVIKWLRLREKLQAINR